jgi:hypothetical protein
VRVVNSFYSAGNYWDLANDSLGGFTLNRNGTDLFYIGRSGATSASFAGNLSVTGSLSVSTGLTVSVASAITRTAISNSVAQFLGTSGTGPVIGFEAEAAAGQFIFRRASASGAAVGSGDNLGYFGWRGAYTTNTYSGTMARIQCVTTQAWDAAGTTLGTAIEIATCQLNGNTLTTVLTIGNGVQFGAPTGGDKGAGTANFAADIYKNNTAYTNPDYVLEKWATGKISIYADKDGASTYDGLKPLREVEAFARKNLHLPRFGQKAGHGLFSGSDAVLASLEEAYLYIFDLEKRIASLEKTRTVPA